MARRRVPRSGDGFAGRASSIVFVSWPLRSGATAQLWTIDADGTRLHRLPGTPKGNDLDPSWSPEGRAIAFVEAPNHTTGGRVFTMRRNGLHLAALTPPWLHASGPAWSPDGTQIAFSATRDGGRAPSQLWVIGVDGSGLRAVTQGDADHTDPAWSPDGSEIAYERSRPVLVPPDFRQGPGNIWIKGLRKGDGHQITHVSAGHEMTAPEWSPDGSSLLSLAISEFATKLWILSADGTRKNLVRSSSASSADLGGVWSPEGGEVLVVEESWRRRNPSLMRLLLMDTAGAHVRTILGAPKAYIFVPDWTAASA